MPRFSPLLSFEDVTVTYPGPRGGELRALDALSLRVEPGEWVAVMGANGSGKSTLAYLAVGLVSPASGRLRTPPPLRIGYLSQHPEHHVVGLTVGDDLRLALAPLGLSEDEVALRIRQWLSRVDMLHALDSPTSALSGGELQRIALAGALARHPDLLVLDEPNAFADPLSARLTACVVGEYLRSAGAGCLWITHSPEEAAQADRVVVLGKGRLVFDGPPRRLWELGDRLDEWGIGRPQATPQGVPGAWRLRRQRGGNTPAVLRMEALAFRYPASARPVLTGVDLAVYEGEAVALGGRSGAGKSTLLQVAAGLEPHGGGRLTVLGTPIPPAGRGRRMRAARAKAVRALLPGVGLAMQQPEAQLFAATVKEELTFGLRCLGIPQAEWRERIEGALEAVGLGPEFLDRSPFALSGGERRKVALAACLAQRPRLYLLDEPTAGLDRPSAAIVARLLRELVEKDGAGVLFTTHDHDLLYGAASRVVRLEDGKVTTQHETAVWSLESDDESGEEVRREAPAVSASERSEAPGNRTDARSLVLGASVLALSVVSVTRWSGLAAAGAVVLTLLALTKTPWRTVKGAFLALLPFMLIAAVFGGGGVAAAGPRGLFGTGAFAGLRMFLTVAALLWVGRAAGLSRMMEAFSALLRPLERVGLPLGTLLAGTLVAMAMFPRLTEEAARITRAQTMRGVQFLRGVRGVWSRVVTLVVPLSTAVLRRAERLGDALVLRGYADGAPWRPRTESWHVRDILVFAALVCSAVVIVLANRIGGRAS